jgi:hypothetical protein
MRRATSRALAVTALIIAASFPAAAQQARGPGRYSGSDQQLGSRDAAGDVYARMHVLRGRIRSGVAHGILDPQEAKTASYKLDLMRRTADNMRRRHHGTLTASGVNYVQGQLDIISRHLHWKQHLSDRGGGEPRRPGWNSGSRERPF